MKRMKIITVIVCIAMFFTACGSKESFEPIASIYTIMEEKSYADALVQLGSLVPDRYNRQEIARLKGICYIGIGKYEAAVEALETALSYNEGFLQEADYDINQYLAAAYYNLGRFEDAEHVYSAMVDLRPKDAIVHYRHGVTFLELSRFEEAKEAFDRAVALEPQNYERIIEIYQAFYKYGYRDLGLDYVENAMEGHADISDYDKGRMYYYTEQYNHAVSSLENVDRKAYPDAALYLGMSYEALGDYNYAASVYTSGIQNSTDPGLFNHLGLCQMKIGAYEDALKAFQKGLACEGDGFRQALRFNEAIAYEYLADFSTAKKLMGDYLKDFPNDAQAEREYEFLKTR